MRSRFASAIAEQLARELGLEDVAIIGTGRDDRVTVGDVRAAVPSIPDGLRDAGGALWRNVRRDYQLRPDEEQLLLAACRTLDEIDRLQVALDESAPTVPGSRGQVRAHPLVRELREHRLALKQLLGASGIGLVDADSYDLGSRGGSRSDAGRQLALIRHHGPRRG